MLFIFLGSCLIFIPPIIPVTKLQAFGEAIFPFTQPGAAEVFLNFFEAVGIEFYGGAMLSFAFGVIDERDELARREREEQYNHQLLLEIEKLSHEVLELSQLVSQLSESNTISRSTRNIVQKNGWLWKLLFG